MKSCRPVEVDRAEVTETGLRLDRRWMIVDAAGRFVTQRAHPQLATVSVAVHGDHVELRADGHGALTLPLDPGPDAPSLRVTVWDDEVDARRASPDAAAWLRTVVGVDGELAWMPPASARPVDPRYARSTDRVGFADGFPLLLAAEASLTDLNRRLALPVTMERFRPNIVVAGSHPFEEDRWSIFRVGVAQCRAVKPCSRCAIVNTDPWTGARSVEPLAALSAYRTSESKVYFGQNVVHSREAIGQWVGVGDEVVVESWRDPSEHLDLDERLDA